MIDGVPYLFLKVDKLCTLNSSEVLHIQKTKAS